MNKTDISNNIKDRATSIRFRTWILTVIIVVTLVFSILVTITTRQAISIVDFVLVFVVQIVTHSVYFPDGDLYGQKNPAFIENRQAYNDKATEINQRKKIKKLREYCKIEFEERKQRYILNECGTLDITLEELNLLKQIPEEQLKKIKQHEFVYIDPKTKEETSKIIAFSRVKRKKLYNLIFKPLPIEQNYPETIMSAVINNGTSAITDGSINYKRKVHTFTVFKFLIWATVIGYVGYTLRDGVGIPQIMQILMYLTALFTTAVLSFSSGEACSKVYKNRFYIELVNFIDAFEEWCVETQQEETILKVEEIEGE